MAARSKNVQIHSVIRLGMLIIYSLCLLIISACMSSYMYNLNFVDKIMERGYMLIKVL